MLALTASSCDGRLLVPTVETTRELNAARAKWNALRITDYEYTLQRLCFCGDIRPMRVTVRGGRAQSVRPEGELLPLTTTEAEWYPSISGLFDVIASALALPAASVRAEYDAARGFPHSVAIDYWLAVQDDEITYVVSAIRVP